MVSILIAGIGNIFMGDDAFGSVVARRLAQRSWPDGVRVMDFGIRSLDLTYELLDPHDAVILVDVVPRGGAPGTLYVIEPEVAPSTTDITMEGHTMNPVEVLRMAAALGGPVQRIFLVGCEPGSVEEMQDGLTDAVRRAADEAIALIESLVGDLLREAKVETATEPR
jgi:hydrogenase maturation protease